MKMRWIAHFLISPCEDECKALICSAWPAATARKCEVFLIYAKSAFVPDLLGKGESQVEVLKGLKGFIRFKLGFLSESPRDAFVF